MIDERLDEQFDACRADTDDVRQPELSGLAEHLASHPEANRRLARVQQFDVAVRSALASVEPPADLAARVLAGLSAGDASIVQREPAQALPDGAGKTSATIAAEMIDVQIVEEMIEVQIVDEAIAAASTPPVAELQLTLAAHPTAVADSSKRGDSPRRSRPFSPFWLGIGLAAAASLGLAIYYAPRGSYTREDILEAAATFCLDEMDKPGRLLSEAVPRGFPYSPAVKRNPRVEWVAARNCLGTSGVLYRLVPGGKQQAYLLVMPARGLQIAGNPLPGTPGFRPLTTRGVTSDCWQERGLVYVLVVQGDEADFHGFLQAQQPII
ncbi:MAG: hypothetical protein K1X74_14915 [Pirellulales bacterium]|nr:hypothetical protein [Pirellulales bacterium]